MLETQRLVSHEIICVENSGSRVNKTKTCSAHERREKFMYFSLKSLKGIDKLK